MLPDKSLCILGVMGQAATLCNNVIDGECLFVFTRGPRLCCMCLISGVVTKQLKPVTRVLYAYVIELQ